VFLFGGPTGVGKTETALLLSRELGGERDALIRVDCQGFQGSGTGHDANTLIWRLLGVAPGYLGYQPGCRGGLLVKVRECPESVLLLDEFEKADATVGKLFLRILDEGKAQDSEGNDLDFRRCFVVLTSNAGVTYQEGPKEPFGFSRWTARPAPQPAAVVTMDELRGDLRSKGLGMEFLARLHHLFLFRGLTPEAISVIVERELDKLRLTVSDKGLALEWDEEVLRLLVCAWDQQLGVRHIQGVLRVAVLDQLSIAHFQGELEGVRVIRLRAGGPAGKVSRRRDGDTLVLLLPRGHDESV
jgi:ATP-dependent Clp protease ATP-binding subunit ClpA